MHSAALRHRLMKRRVTGAVVARILLRCSMEEAGRGWEQKGEEAEECGESAYVDRTGRCSIHTCRRNNACCDALVSV